MCFSRSYQNSGWGLQRSGIGDIHHQNKMDVCISIPKRRSRASRAFICAEKVERVHEFLYLGSLVGYSYSLGILEDVHRRVTEATKMYGRLEPLWRSRKSPKNIKRRLFLVCVSPTLLYGGENWPLPAAASRLIDKCWYKKSRTICSDYRIIWVDLENPWKP